MLQPKLEICPTVNYHSNSTHKSARFGNSHSTESESNAFPFYKTPMKTVMKLFRVSTGQQICLHSTDSAQDTPQSSVSHSLCVVYLWSRIDHWMEVFSTRQMITDETHISNPFGVSFQITKFSGLGRFCFIILHVWFQTSSSVLPHSVWTLHWFDVL